MVKGEIWWAELPSPRGSEPAKKRPVLIVQGDDFNRSNINTVICAAITSNLMLAAAPPNILLEKAHSGLKRTSVINFSQIVTVDKLFCTRLVAMLPKQYIAQINDSLKTIFDIPSAVASAPIDKGDKKQ
ncbi:MAG: type II toxin-antitoxin system PemK/MazF family toxin [Spirochaetaceae bacterium]|jgi:mRNA interferase MazF|nr:type II toxin-antitoxin system PemK/MazF family toxin [Spirochaetaceae bacterium]